MTRSLLILTMSFAIGFALCLVVRAGLHHPYPPAAAMAMGPLVTPPAEHGGGPDGSSLAPAQAAAPPASAAGAAAPDASAPAAPASSRAAGLARSTSSGPELGLPRLGVKTEMVNTICPVCGVEVDVSLPTSLYHGRIIGFGCRPNRCKERFDADPERYGPAALANRKAE